LPRREADPGPNETTVIRAIIFDLDNTLTDFMKMKRAAIDAAVDGMRDAGLALPRDEVASRIYQVYDREGIEYQQVFDIFLNEALGRVDYKILTSGIVAYRRARDSYLVLYPHVNLTMLELLKRGLKLAVVSDAPKLRPGCGWLTSSCHLFDTVVAFEDTGERKAQAVPACDRMLGIAPGGDHGRGLARTGRGQGQVGLGRRSLRRHVRPVNSGRTTS
jgi:putative hydrolase of the HAD superfamily